MKIPDNSFTKIQILEGGDIFEVNQSSVQLRLDSPISCDIFLRFDIAKNPQCEKYLYNLMKSSKKFDMYTTQFDFIGNHIKIFESNPNYVEITTVCDMFTKLDVSRRRIELIDSILNKS